MKQGDKQKKVEETMKHWGYDNGVGFTHSAVSAKGTALTLDNLDSPKDYLTDRLKGNIKKILRFTLKDALGFEGADIDKRTNEILALLTSEVEKERERLLKEVDEKVIGKYEEKVKAKSSEDMMNNAWKIARNALREKQRKALSDIGGGK